MALIGNIINLPISSKIKAKRTDSCFFQCSSNVDNHRRATKINQLFSAKASATKEQISVKKATH